MIMKKIKYIIVIYYLHSSMVNVYNLEFYSKKLKKSIYKDIEIN